MLPFAPICVTSVDDFYPALERGDIKPGTVVVFRYQGPKGAPGMPEMLGGTNLNSGCSC
jgi:dihydroxy-acid dehydratase